MGMESIHDFLFRKKKTYGWIKHLHLFLLLKIKCTKKGINKILKNVRHSSLLKVNVF